MTTVTRTTFYPKHRQSCVHFLVHPTKESLQPMTTLLGCLLPMWVKTSRGESCGPCWVDTMEDQETIAPRKRTLVGEENCRSRNTIHQSVPMPWQSNDETKLDQTCPSARIVVAPSTPRIGGVLRRRHRPRRQAESLRPTTSRSKTPATPHHLHLPCLLFFVLKEFFHSRCKSEGGRRCLKLL